jgi:hypothetical protein
VPTLDELTIEGGAPPPPAAAPAPAPIRPAPGEVAITRPTGQVQTVAEADLQDAIDQGDRLATSAEYANAKMGAAGPVASAITEGVRTATFGLSDVALVEGDKLIEGEAEGERMRQALREMREVNPTANTVGMVAGALAPLAFGSPAGAVGAVEGAGALARAGSRFAAAAPRALIEGGVIGASQQFTEDYLGNHEMVAQKYLASALKGSLMALVIGGGLSAGLGHAGDKLAGLRGRAVESIERAAEGGPYRALGKVGENARGKGLLARMSETADAQTAKGLLPSSSLAASELSKLGRTAEEQSARFNRVGRTARDLGISTAGASKAVQAERATVQAARLGEELGELRKSFSRAAARPSAEAMLREIEETVLRPLDGRAFAASERAAIAPYVKEIAETLGARLDDAGIAVAERPTVEFDVLHKLRRELDDKLYPKARKGFAPPSAPAGAEHLEKIRGILERGYEEGAERAAAELGENTAQKYLTTKAVYADVKLAEKWATKAAAKQAQNNTVGMNTMNLIGHAGQAALSGHPLALVAPIANHIRDRYGNQIAAAVLDRATRIQSIQRAAQAFDDKLDAAVISFFGKGKPPARLASAEKVSPEAARALRDAARNPAQLADRVSSAVASTGLAEVAPQTARAMTSTLMRAGTWLSSRLPPEPPPRALAFGSTKPRPVGPRAQKEIDNAFRALDADAFVDDLARGRVDRQALEAMKFINPDAYDDIVGRLRRYGMENRPDLTRQQAVALSIITGTPLTPMMKPETINGFQQAYAQEEPPHDPSAPGQTEKKQIGSGGPPPGRGQSSRAFASGTDKMEASHGS